MGHKQPYIIFVIVADERRLPDAYLSRCAPISRYIPLKRGACRVRSASTSRVGQLRNTYAVAGRKPQASESEDLDSCRIDRPMTNESGANRLEYSLGRTVAN